MVSDNEIRGVSKGGLWMRRRVCWWQKEKWKMRKTLSTNCIFSRNCVDKRSIPMPRFSAWNILFAEVLSPLGSQFSILWHLLLLFTCVLYFYFFFVSFIADPCSHLPGATVILNTFTKLQFNFYSRTGRRQASQPPSHQPSSQRKINEIS